MSEAVVFERLAKGEGKHFERMTFPAYRHMLALERCPRLPNENETEIVDPLVVVGVSDGAAVGLAIADLPVNEDIKPRLLSLFVVPDFRVRGIGEGLVEGIEREMRVSGKRVVETVYTTGKPSIDWVEKILARREWSSPKTRMVSVRLDVELAKQAPWLWRQRLSPDWEIFPWAELSDDHRREIYDSNVAEQWIAPDLEPWRHDHQGFDAGTSLGLRRNGVVVGWNITHRMDHETLRFTCSFIRKPLGRRGKILPLYTESFRRMADAGLRFATLTVPLHHRGMAAFSKRWIGPWSSFLGETRGSEKLLDSHGALE